MGLAVRRIAVDLAQVIREVVAVGTEGAAMSGIGSLAVLRTGSDVRAVLVGAVLPITARSQHGIEAIAATGFARDAIEDVLSIFQLLHRAAQLLELSLRIHCATPANGKIRIAPARRPSPSACAYRAPRVRRRG